MRWGGDDSLPHSSTSSLLFYKQFFFLQETDIDGFSWHPTFKSIAEKWRYNVQDPAAVLELDKLMEEWFIFISSNFITHF